MNYYSPGAKANVQADTSLFCQHHSTPASRQLSWWREIHGIPLVIFMFFLILLLIWIEICVCSDLNMNLQILILKYTRFWEIIIGIMIANYYYCHCSCLVSGGGCIICVFFLFYTYYNEIRHQLLYLTHIYKKNRKTN